ncbi:hypothetical protein A3Q56_07966 [Intoshia linei]|uniref:Serine/threonine-protein kinase 1 n=1 Tax=Intoshia linei TaxID=1819745 RepID=A0A177AQN9_9BILA|nr:hypothetical protein A3Q56_07966 [Intoshia linei]
MNRMKVDESVGSLPISYTKNEEDENGIPKFLMNKRCSVMHKYNVTSPLGSGGFGTVFAATRKMDDKPVAFKLIPRKKIPSWCMSKMSLIPTEIHILTKLKHIDSVIKILEVYERSDSYIVIMERPTPSMDLFDYITKRNYLTEIEGANMIKQLIETLQQVHAAGIVHRDIKDENILVDLQTRKITLIDFGGAAPLKKALYTDFDGTRVYSPPEWVAYHCYYAIPACVWSIGILTYNMLYGDVPFDNDELIVAASPKYKNKNLSNLAKSFISSCLNHRQSMRPNLEQLLDHQWITKNNAITNEELLIFIKQQEAKLEMEELKKSLKLSHCGIGFQNYKERQHAYSDSIVVRRHSPLNSNSYNEIKVYNEGNENPSYYKKPNENSCTNQNSNHFSSSSHEYRPLKLQLENEISPINMIMPTKIENTQSMDNIYTNKSIPYNIKYGCDNISDKNELEEK